MEKGLTQFALFFLLFALNFLSIYGAEEIDELRFQLEVETAKLNKPLTGLNDKYRNYLEAQKKAYQDPGKLKGLLAVDEELKNFEQSTGGELSTFPELNRLQRIYREQRATLLAKSRVMRLQLIQGYRKSATSLASEWTKAGRIEDAKAALAEAERLAVLEKEAANFTPTLANPGKEPGTPAPPIATPSFPLRVPTLEDRPWGRIRVFGTFIEGKEKKTLELGEWSKHRDFIDLGISGAYPKNRMALRKRGGIELSQGSNPFKKFSDDSRLKVVEIVSSSNRSLLLFENGKVWGEATKLRR